MSALHDWNGLRDAILEIFVEAQDHDAWRGHVSARGLADDTWLAKLAHERVSGARREKRLERNRRRRADVALVRSLRRVYVIVPIERPAELTRRLSRPWTPEEDARVCAERGAGRAWDAIASDLGRTVYAVKKRFTVLATHEARRVA